LVGVEVVGAEGRYGFDVRRVLLEDIFVVADGLLQILESLVDSRLSGQQVDVVRKRLEPLMVNSTIRGTLNG
jgi:hypothetical protein